VHESRHLGLGVRMQNDERILDSPVGRIGDMRHARQAVKGDVVLVGVARQHAQRALAQIPGVSKIVRKSVDRGLRGAEQSQNFGVAHRVRAELAPLFDFLQAMAQCADEKLPTAGIFQQVILKIRVALDDPYIAQNFEEHACRAAGAALAAQFLEQTPQLRAEQSDDNFTVGERGVVVRDLAQARYFDAGVPQRSLDHGIHGERFRAIVAPCVRPAADRVRSCCGRD
jgi:hypothetical protein